MIEKEIIDYLNEYLDEPVSSEVSENPPLRFVIVEKTGGSRDNYINTSTLAIQSYAESMYEASMLNEQVKALMDVANQLEVVSASKYQTDYNYTDIRSKKYRYQCVYSLTHYL